MQDEYTKHTEICEALSIAFKEQKGVGSTELMIYAILIEALCKHDVIDGDLVKKIAQNIRTYHKALGDADTKGGLILLASVLESL